jgi:diguanylate cyclase (GGDEF)-like protein
MDASTLALPVPDPILIQPRIYAAYAAVLGAALLACLYLYRRREFILYWTAGWLLIAGSLSARSFDPAGSPYGFVITDGIGGLMAVCSAGLFLLAPDAMNRSQFSRRRTFIALGIFITWFVAAPFVLSREVTAASGYLGASGILTLVAVRYLRLWRAVGSVGAFLIGLGTGGVAITNVVGATIAASMTLSPELFNTLLGVNVVLNVFVALGMHVFVFEDMTDELRRANAQLAHANEEIRRIAGTDALTGCHNRMAFDDIERREIQRHWRYGVPLSVIFVDVNHFKLLNDTLGHDRGDETLRQIGAMLRRHVRETDYVIRWGGDEFVLLLACHEPEARAKAEELKTAIQTEGLSTAMKVPLGLSTGVAEVARDATSVTDAIRMADNRMYMEKAAQRTAAG